MKNGMYNGMGHAMNYGHKGVSGSYDMPMKKGSHYGKSAGGKNPLKGKSMERGPSDPTPSHKGYAK